MDAASSSSDTMEMEDDDPVVKSLDVYYTPELLASLTLLQYPDRPPRPETLHPLLPQSMRPDVDAEDDAPPRVQLEARYKPSSQHLEVDIPVEKNSQRYNRERGQSMAQGVIRAVTTADTGDDEDAKGKGKKRSRKVKEDTPKPIEDEDEQPKELEKITYRSTSVPDVTNYLVGVVKDGEHGPSTAAGLVADAARGSGSLHLSPVTQTFQMRPSLSYLDNIITLERRRKREAKANADSDHESEAEISDTEIKKEEAKAVQVSVKLNAEGASRAPGGGNGRADASLFAPLRAEEGETWVKLAHHPVRVSGSGRVD